jgi:hypothetical protein
MEERWFIVGGDVVNPDCNATVPTMNIAHASPQQALSFIGVFPPGMAQD